MEILKRILTWLAVMAALTIVAVGIWYMLSMGSLSTASLKWLQFVQTLGTFAIPPLMCAWWWSGDYRPLRWLGLDRRPNGKVAVLAILIMVCAIPGINLLADLNGKLELPESLDFIEHFLRQQEDEAAALTKRFLETDSILGVMINVGLLAVLAAFAEELSFRGTLQQILGNKSAAIWITAIIFSAVHMQFYGFVPRMLMGALFGYAFVWTGNLWIPMLMHFTNNSIAVLSYYLFDETAENSKNIADTIGAGDTWWLGLLSLAAVSGLVWLLRRISSEGCNERPA